MPCGPAIWIKACCSKMHDKMLTICNKQCRQPNLDLGSWEKFVKNVKHITVNNNIAKYNPHKLASLFTKTKDTAFVLLYKLACSDSMDQRQ